METSELLRIVGFYVVALVTLASAFIAVFYGNILRSVFALLFTLFGVAVLYLFVHADFLAATQVLIYVGGVLVLLLFGIMLTQRMVEVNIRTGRIQFFPSLLALGLMFLFLLFVVFGTQWNIQGPANFQETTHAIGKLLMTDWLLPFEVSSILLLAALVGAVSIARTRKVQQ
jgi:NADH:ubiquinone oxidoreductase subunit 6 (subunit J)